MARLPELKYAPFPVIFESYLALQVANALKLSTTAASTEMLSQVVARTWENGEPLPPTYQAECLTSLLWHTLNRLHYWQENGYPRCDWCHLPAIASDTVESDLLCTDHLAHRQDGYADLANGGYGLPPPGALAAGYGHLDG